MAYLTAAKGLVVYRNELSTPEGSLSKADNINIDEPDVITPRRGFADYANELPSDDGRVDQLLSYKGIILRHFGDVLQYENVNNTFVNFNTEIKQLDEEIRIKSQESNGNLYFTSTDGIKKISLKKALDMNPDSILSAGAPAGIDVTAQAVVQEGGFLPPENKVAYRVLFGYKDANENLILGSPSPRYTVANYSKNISLPEKTVISLRAIPTPTQPAIQHEDYILYSTKVEDGTSGSDYMFWFNTIKPKPQETKINLNVDVPLTSGTGQYAEILYFPVVTPPVGAPTQTDVRQGAFEISNDIIYLGTSDGLYISRDNGKTFVVKTYTNLRPGFTADPNTVQGNQDIQDSNNVIQILVVDDTLYVATVAGLSISTDEGETFTFTTSHLPSGATYGFITDIKYSKVGQITTVYFASDTDVGTAITKTSNQGQTFSRIFAWSSLLSTINSLYVSEDGNTIMAATETSNLRISTDGGVIFNQANLLAGTLSYVTVRGTKIYVSSSQGLHTSTNGGTSFVLNSNTLVDDATHISFLNDDTFFISTEDGLVVTTNGGTSFAARTTEDTLNTIIYKNKLYVATKNGLYVNEGINDGDYILLDTKNLSKFFIWFKRTSTGTVPDVDAKFGRTIVEVDLTTIQLNFPSQLTDTVNANKIAAEKLAEALSQFTNDMIVTILNDQVTVTDKLNGSINPGASTNNTIDITLDVKMGASAVSPDDHPNVEEAYNRKVLRVDLIDIISNRQAALALAEVISNNVTGVEVSTKNNSVTITNETPGNIILDCSSNIVAPEDQIQINIVEQGLVASGEFCNTSVTFVVPSGVNTNYFYQLYRTELAAATADTTFAQIEPSDEFNLVFEKPVSSDGVTIPTEITIIDDTPDDYRKSNTYLYSNGLTGAGTLQTNEQPPVAKDLALFKNTMFYANTKGLNFLDISLLPGVDLLVGESVTITDNLKSATFNFVGEPRTYTLTFDTKANTNEFQILKLYTASNEQKLAFWIAKSINTAESQQIIDLRNDGFEVLRVDIGDVTSAESIKDIFEDILLNLNTFFKIDETASTSTSLVFEHTENGSSLAPTIENKLVSSAWDIDSDDGVGEDPSLNNVLVSSNLSPSLALDITARSLVRIINNDINSPVSAQYLSTVEGVPGKIKLKSKQTEDQSFYVGLSTAESNIKAVFSPDLPEVFTSTVYSTSIDPVEGAITSINITPHTLVAGDEIIIRSYETTYVKTVLSSSTATHVKVSGNIIPSGVSDPPDEIIFYKTTVFSTNDENPSRIYYSKVSQPEAVPIVNYLDVGSRDQSIKRIVALRDSLLVLKEDGIYVVSGSAASNFSVRLLSSTSVIICPDSAQVLNNNLYFLSTQGVLTVNESSDGIISRQIENLIKDVTRPNFNFAKVGFGVGYENDRAYLLWLPTEAADEVATQCYRYNIFERNWTRWTIPATCGAVNRVDDTLYIGDGVRPYVLKERKNNNRTDHSDRNFTVDFPAGSHLGEKIILGNVTEVEVGDTLVQTQYVTIEFFNRLLRKLDADVGLENNYEQLLKMQSGENISLKVQALNSKLVADDASGQITAFTASENWETLRDQLNNMITQLNKIDTEEGEIGCDSAYKNYKPAVDIIDYEAIITAVDRSSSTVTVNYDLPFVEGTIEVYKHINCVIEWQPQHFGDPSQLKQVREASVMFDQNNFYTAKLGFATDLSQNFEDIPMPGRGVGYWGYGQWGTADFYWGGDGNDSPFRTVVPREKQRCRYLTLKMEHNEARSSFRVVGVSCPIRPLSTRAYRK